MVNKTPLSGDEETGRVEEEEEEILRWANGCSAIYDKTNTRHIPVTDVGAVWRGLADILALPCPLIHYTNHL